MRTCWRPVIVLLALVAVAAASSAMAATAETPRLLKMRRPDIRSGCEIVLASRSSHVDVWTMDMGRFRPATAAKLDRFMAGSPMAGCGQAVIAACRYYDVNPYLIVAIAWLESHCGASTLGRLYHNPFGIGAVDDDPEQARSYVTFEDAIWDACRLVRSYRDDGLKTITEIGARWASDPDWWRKVGIITERVMEG